MNPFLKTVFITLILLMTCPLPLAAQNFEEMLEKPDVSEAFGYCDWYFEGGGNELGLESVLALLAEEEEEETTAPQRASAALIKAGVEIAKAAKNKKACNKAFASGLKKYNKTFSKTAKKLQKGEKIKASEDLEIAKIQQKISTLWVEDQARRIAYSKHRNTEKKDATLWASALSRAYATLIDATSTSYMKEVLSDYDWIDAHRFGQSTSSHAWLLVQHADRDRAFQALALERMTPYLKNEGVSKSNYAYLFDRVAVNYDRKQRYGTQPTWECTATGLVLAPLEEPETVNARRAEMGMDTVEESLARMSAGVCR